MRTGFRIRKKSANLAYSDQELRETGVQNLKALEVFVRWAGRASSSVLLAECSTEVKKAPVVDDLNGTTSGFVWCLCSSLKGTDFRLCFEGFFDSCPIIATNHLEVFLL